MNPTFGWMIDYPASMQVAPFAANGRVQTTGVTISNVPLDLSGPLDPLRSFPPDGAALRVWHNEGGPVSPTYEDDATFPLSLSDFEEIQPYVGGSEPTPLFASFNGDGIAYAAAVWFGPETSGGDRSAIGDAVASLRFPPTRLGTTINDRLIVLGAASGFEVGSVTRFDRSELPINEGYFDEYQGDFSFYLVRGTSGFYGVATDFLGNGSRCDLAVEHHPLRFSCPALGAVWDRDGRVLTPPALPPADGQTDLLVLPTPISWDGNVMIDPFGNWPEAAVEAWS